MSSSDPDIRPPYPLEELATKNEKALGTVAFVDGGFGGIAIRLPPGDDYQAYMLELARQDPKLGREMKKRGWIT